MHQKCDLDLHAGFTCPPSEWMSGRLHRCSICFEDFLLPGLLTASAGPARAPSSSTSASSCGHHMCRGCASKHVQACLTTHQYPILCPSPGCGLQLVHADIIKLLGQADGLHQLFAQLQVEHAIPAAERLFCPHPSCSAMLSRCRTSVPASRATRSSAGASLPSSSSETAVTCPMCNRDFCASCLIPGWHKVR